MLKIKDDIGIERLKAYGFTPRFDEYTGQVSHYVKVTTDIADYGIKIKHELDKRIRIFKDRKERWIIYKCDDYLDMDTLYDLIQAGLVEKIKE